MSLERSSPHGKSIDSKPAFLEENRLVISRGYESAALQSCDLIVANDYQYPIVNPANPVEFFQVKGRNPKFGIFQLGNFSEEIELHLDCDHFKIGVPKRENFKLCKLESDVATEVKINGKLDHSMSSGMERRLLEQHFIFCLHTGINRLELGRGPFGPFPKTIPKPKKAIGLMKELW